MGKLVVNNLEKLDETTEKVITKRILDLERENIRTKRNTNTEMVERIKRIIQEEVNKCL